MTLQDAPINLVSNAYQLLMYYSNLFRNANKKVAIASQVVSPATVQQLRLQTSSFDAWNTREYGIWTIMNRLHILMSHKTNLNKFSQSP